MTEFTADDIRKAADVQEWASQEAGSKGLLSPYGMRDYADRLEAEAAAKARHDEQVEEQVEELARVIRTGLGRLGGWADIVDNAREEYRSAARAVLADGRWVRVEDGA